MSDPSIPSNLRDFHCEHCNGKIRIPKNLPVTTGPCPHCNGIITSPAPIPEIPEPEYKASEPSSVHARQSIHIPEPEPTTSDPVPEAIPVARQSYVEHPLKESVADKLGATNRDRRAEEPKKSIAPIIVLAILLLLFAAAAIFFVFKEIKKKPTPVSPPPASGQVAPTKDARSFAKGGREEAFKVLSKFLAAKTVDEKLPYILNAEKLKPTLESFYGGGLINDSDTPAEAFAVNELNQVDRERGIFMMIFDQPAQLDIKDFFRPLAIMEVQYGLVEPDLLLSTVARIGNFASEPLRVNVFFKRTPEGLKIDWETFAQTKYRTLLNLVELPEPGHGGVFRVIISEDVAETGKLPPPGTKTYRITDPASLEANARINVKIDSPIGKTLSEINWIGKENRPTSRTATVELNWSSGDQPTLQISRFICWEFLHLGGDDTAAVQ